MNSLSLFSYLPNSAEGRQLQQDLETLDQFKSPFGDKLAINPKGELLITKGGFFQAAKRTVLDLRCGGGYNRNDVAKRLETITQQLETIGNSLSDQTHNTTAQELYAFLKKIKFVYNKVNDIEYRARAASSTMNSTRASTKLIEVCDRLRALQDSVETLQKKQGGVLPKEQRPVIDYQTKLQPLHLKNIRVKMRKREMPQDILEQAKIIESQRPSTLQKVARHATLFFSYLLFTSFMLSVGGLLVPVQYLLYNPIKRRVTGEANAKNLMQWFEVTLLSLESRLLPPVNEALNKLANQLLRAPNITDEHIEAFVKLAPNVQSVDYSVFDLVSNDLSTLIAMSNLSLSKTVKGKLTTYFQNNQAILPMTYFEFKSLCGKADFFEGELNDEDVQKSRRPTLVRISPQQLEKVVTALGKTKQSSIDLGVAMMQVHASYLTKLMTSHGFRQKSSDPTEAHLWVK